MSQCPGNVALEEPSGSDGLAENLAARLRQSIQGCSLHLHGPVQAWAAIEEAREAGAANPADIARLAAEACSRRILELKAERVKPDNPRILKEELTRSFIERLLRE